MPAHQALGSCAASSQRRYLWRRFAEDALDLVTEQRRIECEIPISRVRRNRDRDVVESDAEIDGLRSDDDDRLAVPCGASVTSASMSTRRAATYSGSRSTPSLIEPIVLEA